MTKNAFEKAGPAAIPLFVESTLVTPLAREPYTA